MIEPQQILIYQSQDRSTSIDVTLEDKRLRHLGKGRDYFDELTRRPQDIRTSERRDRILGNKAGIQRNEISTHCRLGKQTGRQYEHLDPEDGPTLAEARITTVARIAWLAVEELVNYCLSRLR